MHAIVYKDNIRFKAVVDIKRQRWVINGYPIAKKDKRKNNKRCFYYIALDINDLIQYMQIIAPFKKERVLLIDDGFQITKKVIKPWIWYKD